MNSLRRLAIAFALCAALGAPSSAPGQASAYPDMRVLADSEMGPYLKTLEQLVELGLDAQPDVAAQGMRGATGSAALVGYTARMQSALASQNFTLESFSEVHWSAMMAYGALELEKHGVEMEQARAEQQAQLEAMRAQMSPEQFAMIEQTMAGGMAMMNPFGEVPPENLALIRKYRSQLDAILKDGQ